MRMMSKQLPIVCISGSTKFKKEFQEQAARLENMGAIVLTTHIFTHADNLPITDDEVKMYEAMYRQKIDMCDRLIVLNVGQYLGESTRKEIEYATKKCKTIQYLEPITDKAVLVWLSDMRYRVLGGAV